MIGTLIQNNVINSQIQRMVRHRCLDLVRTTSQLLRTRDFLVHLNDIRLYFFGCSFLHLFFCTYFVRNNFL